MPIQPEYLHLVYPELEVRGLLYGRNSYDPSGKGRSVASQIDEGRAMSERYSWPIVHVYDKDVSRSASRHARRRRDDFEQLLEDIEAGLGNLVIAFEASRYYRDLEAYVRLRNVCTAAGVLLCYNGTVYDLSKRADRKTTAMDAIDAEDEAEAIRERSLRGHRSRVAKNRPSGHIPFGYRRRYDSDTGDLIDQVPHPERAKLVVEIFERFDAGKSLYSMIRWLEGIPEARYKNGKPWTQGRLTTILKNPVYLGKRHRKGEIIGDASWDAIITDLALWHRVQERLADPTRRNMHDTQVRHLMSGLALCGRCPQNPPPPKLRTHPAPGNARPYPGRDDRPRNYVCSENSHIGIAEQALDAYVEEAVVQYLGSPAARAAFEPPDSSAKTAEAQRTLTQLRAQRDEARKAAATLGPDGKPTLSVSSLVAVEALLGPKILQAEKDAAGVRPIRVSGALKELLAAVPDVVEKLWEGLTMEEKRDVLRQVVTVRLNPAPYRGVQRITPGRITLSFRGTPGFVADA